MSEQAGRTLRGLADFFDTPLDARLARHLTYSPIEAALSLFKDVAGSVPAYRAFLDEHGVAPASIRTPADFSHLPLCTKPNYVARYPLAARCREGRIAHCDIIAVSSGSTGVPSFWPRFLTDELEIATRFEQVFYDSFEADLRPTLAVVCFALGTWVGGLYTISSCRHLAAKGYPITVVAPGNHKDEILRVVEGLGAAFEQVVLLGYPPFLKDVIDTGRARGVPWARYRVRICTAGEFSARNGGHWSWSGSALPMCAGTRRPCTVRPTRGCSVTRPRYRSLSGASLRIIQKLRARCSARRACRRSYNTTP